MERGEFQDLNLRYKTAYEAHRLAVERNNVLERNGGTTTADLRKEEEAMQLLQAARREILISLGVDVSFDS